MNGWLFNLHLKRRFEVRKERGAIRGERDLGCKAVMGALVGAYNLQRVRVFSVNLV